MKRFTFFLFLFAFLFVSCSKSSIEEQLPIDNTPKELTIFCVNDIHGEINNFAKLLSIVNEERQSKDVIVVSAGDLFSGNPVVDNHPDKGFPMIDLMNRVGFDLACFGNHEFDYGLENLKNRMNQSQFQWVCANIDTQNSTLPNPFAYKTINKKNIKVTFLGLVETNGKEDATIPSTHPWRVNSLDFKRPEDVVALYATTKKDEEADLYICLSHLGFDGNAKVLGDIQLANKFPFFDLIIGGHSHSKVNTIENNIPIVQAGSNLNYVGKIELLVKNKAIEEFNFNLINLNDYQQEDNELKKLILDYNDQEYLTDVIGYSNQDHTKSEVGCFYSDALRLGLNVDVSFQNTGGIRASLNQGDITKREIYEISPFNNGTVIYQMSVADIKKFLFGSESGFYYSGMKIQQVEREIIIKDLNNKTLADNVILRIGINDYIAAVHDSYFPDNGIIQENTDAETIISYLISNSNTIDYNGCNRYFKAK